MNSKHRRTLAAIFAHPVRVALNGERAVFHRPHPESEASKAAVRSVREFRTNAGVTA